MTDYVPFYRYSLNNARHCCEVDKWRESHKANMDCAVAIKKAIGDNFKDNHFNSDCVNAIIKEFGFDRVNFILRYNLKKAQHDERYSKENREWGKGLCAPDSNMRTEYLINEHPVLLNAFIDSAREEWAKLNLFDDSHCDDKTGVDLEGKILVISPTRMNDKYKTPEDQLFMATGGFGCSPSKSARAVYGYFLKDDEHCRWSRDAFIGILKEEFVPDWVKEKYTISNNTVNSHSEADENFNNTLTENKDIAPSM